MILSFMAVTLCQNYSRQVQSVCLASYPDVPQCQVKTRPRDSQQDGDLNDIHLDSLRHTVNTVILVFLGR